MNKKPNNRNRVRIKWIKQKNAKHYVIWSIKVNISLFNHSFSRLIDSLHSPYSIVYACTVSCAYILCFLIVCLGIKRKGSMLVNFCEIAISIWNTFLVHCTQGDRAPKRTINSFKCNHWILFSCAYCRDDMAIHLHDQIHMIGDVYYDVRKWTSAFPFLFVNIITSQIYPGIGYAKDD